MPRYSYDRIAHVPYTRSRDVCSENLRRNPVKKVEFQQDGATLVSSDDVETIWWDVATGAQRQGGRPVRLYEAWERALRRDQERRPHIRHDTRGVDGKKKVA
jgi:hypothetical protein